MLATDLLNAFDVDTAVGAQLDILGKYVGVSRLIGTPIERPYFAFSDYDGTVRPNGFRDYTIPAQNAAAIWYNYTFYGTSNTALSDDAYRFVLKLQIFLNTNNATLASIQQYLFTYLNGLVSLVDNADMTLTYTFLSTGPISPDVLKLFLPKPMGVLAIYVYPTSSAAPTPIVQIFPTVFTPVNYVATTSGTPATATPSPAGPALYLWEKVSGDDIQIVSPYTVSTQFRGTFNAWESRTAIFRCRVTTIPGAFVSYTNNVSVTITVTP